VDYFEDGEDHGMIEVGRWKITEEKDGVTRSKKQENLIRESHFESHASTKT